MEKYGRKLVRTRRVQSDSRHRVHMGFCDVLDHDWDIVVPRSDGFIVRRRDETSIFVDERNRVDGTQVLVVFLGDLSRVHVILVAAGLIAFNDDHDRRGNVPE